MVLTSGLRPRARAPASKRSTTPPYRTQARGSTSAPPRWPPAPTRRLANLVRRRWPARGTPPAPTVRRPGARMQPSRCSRRELAGSCGARPRRLANPAAPPTGCSPRPPRRTLAPYSVARRPGLVSAAAISGIVTDLGQRPQGFATSMAVNRTNPEEYGRDHISTRSRPGFISILRRALRARVPNMGRYGATRRCRAAAPVPRSASWQP